MLLTSSSLPDHQTNLDSSSAGDSDLSVIGDIAVTNIKIANASGVATRVVLDTSVLVADPTSMLNVPGCDVVIPLTVVEELDGLKTRMDDVGRSARTALRTLEDLRRIDLQMRVDGPEGFTMHGTSSLAKISRDPLDIVGAN